MIKLATVFSGIGAIEHALDRMGLEHKIVFACDNGDVDILNKEISVDIDEVGAELQNLEKIIETIGQDNEVEDLYKMQLVGMLNEALNEYEMTIKSIKEIPKHNDKLCNLLQLIGSMDNLKLARKKEYLRFATDIGKGSAEQQQLKELQIILEIANDYKKDNPLDKLGEKSNFISIDGINWSLISKDLKELYDFLEKYNGKKIIRKVQDLAQRAGQLHEKINYMATQRELETYGSDWLKRKKHVDSLYLGLENRNKVKQSYMANYDLSDDHFHWNVAFLDGRQYAKEVDLFVGGSPCQSFSLVGKQRGLDDTRGTLFYEYARLIDEIKPKVFIYENVRAVTSHDSGKTWRKMQEIFEELGYNFSWTVFKCKELWYSSKQRAPVCGRNKKRSEISF